VYRGFTKDFYKTASALSKLTQKDMEACFDDACKRAFDITQAVLIAPPIPAAPDCHVDFELPADTSKEAVGAAF